MMDYTGKSDDGTVQSPNCIGDLLTLLELRLGRKGGDISRISRVLLDVLPAMLGVEFVYLKLALGGNRVASESASVSKLMGGIGASGISVALVEAFGPKISEWPQRATIDFGGRRFAVALTRTGAQAHAGVLVAGSARSSFPEQVERLLLEAAGNRVTIAVSEVHAIDKQKRYLTEIDARVEQRTGKFGAGDRALAEEIAGRTCDDSVKRNSAFLEQAQRLTKTGSIWWKVSTGEIAWSEETYRLIGYPSTVTPTLALVIERCHPEDWERVGAIVDNSARYGTDLDLEYRIVMVDGTIKLVRVVLKNVGLDAGKPEFLGAVTDVTECRASEERLQRSEALLAAGERIGLTGTFSWRVDTSQPSLSRQLKCIFEFEDSTLVSVAEVIKRVHPEDLVLVSEEMEKVRHDGTNPDFEIRVIGRGGRIKFLRVVACVTRLGGSAECIGLVQEITERRNTEEIRDAVRAQLSQLTRFMSLGELTASIAHEVNQPLSGIITNAGTCLTVLGSNPPNIAVAINTARRTLRDGNRAAKIISRLREQFRRKASTIEPIDLNEVALDVLGIMSTDLKKARVTLRLELADDLPHVAGNLIQIQLVIFNLIRNATDAMCEVDDRPRQLIVQSMVGQQGCTAMSFQDSGSGFGSTPAEGIFSAFYTTKCGGLGIGLSVCRTIIESHDGRIWAEPNDGLGAILKFSLPQYLRHEDSNVRQ